MNRSLFQCKTMQIIRQLAATLMLLTVFAGATAQTCQPPASSQLFANNITLGSATVNCNTISGASLYQFQYRPSGTNNWTLTTSTSQTFNYLSGLLAYTTYQFQCRVYCTNGWTSFSASQSFTTSTGVGSCTNPIEIKCSTNYTGSNNTSNYNYTSYPFAPYGDLTGPEAFHRLTITFPALVTITMTPQTQDLDLFLLSSCSNTDGLDYSQNSGTNTETIAFNLSPGIYYVIVDGWNGAISNYSLNISCSQSTACAAPSIDGIYATDVTCSTARLNCSSGGYNWSWAYRQLNTVNWTNLPVTSIPYYDLSGLQASTTYEFKSAKLCSNNVWSDWSPIRQFTTSNCTPTGNSCNNPIIAYCGYTYSGNNGTGGKNITTYKYNGQIITNEETGPEVIYQITLATAGPLNISLSGLTGDLDLFLLNNCNNNAVVAYSGNSGSYGEVISLGNLPAGTYQIVIDGWSNTISNYNLKVTCNGIIPISNDEPCYPTVIIPYTSCYLTNATNVNATPTTNPLPPAECNTSNMHDVWFQVQIPVTGKILVSTFPGSMADGLIAVYAGPFCTGLTNYGGCFDYNANGDEMPDIQIQGIPGSNVYLRIWGYGGLSGNFSLCATIVTYFQAGIPVVTVGSGLLEADDRMTTVKEDFKKETVAQAPTLRVYPVPTSDLLHLETHLSEETQVQVQIFDLVGQFIQEVTPTPYAAGDLLQTIDVSALVPGMYVVKLKVGTQEVISRFIKT